MDAAGRELWCVDRIEDGIAVLESPDGIRQELRDEELPAQTREGSVLIKQEDGGFVIDEGETSKRRKRNAELLRRLMEGED